MMAEGGRIWGDSLNLCTHYGLMVKLFEMLTHSLFHSFSGRSYSKTLQQAPLSLLPRRICQQHFHGAFTSRMLCAGSIQAERRVDSCRGDSGGPLVCERPGGGWVVYGVTSWGHACRTQQSPGVYTKVSAFSSCDGCFNWFLIQSPTVIFQTCFYSAI